MFSDLRMAGVASRLAMPASCYQISYQISRAILTNSPIMPLN
jgi:hypothetical protein